MQKSLLWPEGSGYDARHLEANRVILYEYPFNERIRTYLRLEQLFQRLGELIPSAQALQHHYALTTIFEIMDVAARADLKSDVLKDLEKQKHVLQGYKGNPSIAESVLDQVIAQMSNWEADSVIAQFNASKPGQAYVLPAEFAHVLEASLHWARLSGSAMDPSMGALVARRFTACRPVAAAPAG